MKSLLALLLAAPAIAVAADKARESWQPFTTTLQPGKVHEVCTRMEKGETRRYHWKADNAVDFNVHHHRGDQVFYPVQRNAMRGDGGSFTAREADEYCWMWTARKAKSKIEGRLEDPPRR
ncbi:MAG TPA: hypothetical protein VFK48_09705 [Usitatibacter sp.]|nr:hypothetical protein [Usitatibacter sp.]